MKHVIAAAAIVVVALQAPANSDIVNVPDDQPTIQAGIDAAKPGDEVVVAQGTYVENINFNGKAITVRSTDPTAPAVVVSTIINGGGSGVVVTCQSGEGADTVLSGFVITGGNGTSGGGMRNVLNSSPTVTNCTFSDNHADFGGGMGNINGSSPTVTNCTFSGNTGSGGGMFNSARSSPTVTNCTFSGNSTIGKFTFGGGMLNSGSSPTVTNCTFSGNSAKSSGGGMSNAGGSNPTVTNCTVCGNTPDQVSGTFTDGGGNFMTQFCPPPAAPCPADLDGDGMVSAIDLALLLGNWGPCF